MPSTSKKQHNFMEAIANNPAFAKKVGIKQSVGQDFAAADKGKKFKGGGMAKENTKDDMDQDKKLIKKAFGMHDKQLHENKKTNLTNLKKGGTAMAKETMGPKTMKDDVESGSNKLTKFGESAVQKRGKTKGANLGDSGKDIGIEGGMKKGGKVKKMAGGGMASSRADGIASKGKTKGRFC